MIPKNTTSVDITLGFGTGLFPHCIRSLGERKLWEDIIHPHI